ncbi:MAG TPA: outer membrane beta-barrel protein [Vicinamibacterales bacterium]
MMRLSRLAMIALVMLSCARAVSAQTPAAATTEDPPFYGEFGGGPTFGHHSSGYYGGEVGYRVWNNLSVAVEVGHMGNIGSQDLDDRAAIIASSVGATFAAAYQVTYYDFGVRYAFNMPDHWIKPYASVGFGAAHVTAVTGFSVNGTPVTPESIGITTGNDLNGTETKGFIMIGGGATAKFKERYFGDLSFRYGRILPDTAAIDGDTGVNTLRLEFQVGVRF